MINTQSWNHSGSECFINTSMLAVCPPSVSGCYIIISSDSLAPLSPCFEICGCLFLVPSFPRFLVYNFLVSSSLVTSFHCVQFRSMFLVPTFLHIFLILQFSFFLVTSFPKSACLPLFIFPISPRFFFLLDLFGCLFVLRSIVVYFLLALSFFDCFTHTYQIRSYPQFPSSLGLLVSSSLVHLFPFFLPLIFLVPLFLFPQSQFFTFQSLIDVFGLLSCCLDWNDLY